MAKGNAAQGWIVIAVIVLIAPLFLYALLPLWAFILVVLAAAAGFGLLVYYGVKQEGVGFLAKVGQFVDAAFSKDEKSRSAKASKPKVARPPPYWTSQLIEQVGGQCEIQSCRKIQYLQVHHIEEHARGGSNRLSNLIVVCPNHHGDCDKGAINKTRQRAIIGRAKRFKEERFQARWNKSVIERAKAKQQVAEDPLAGVFGS